ncbi:MAG: Glu-tRNA(Gln) amidotransferase subunit GatE [Candidatus Hecatellaceae archaeon]
MSELDYEALGLKVGLEIHRQLDTKHKLFCACPTKLTKEKVDLSFLRRLRPTASELWEVDPAALFEFQKGYSILYEAEGETSCLVEMDEEPPHEINAEAVEAAVQIALMVNAEPVDEVHVMRKIVIDGSNTCGFQRTCIVALGGWVEVDGKRVPIQTICLEEDAARKMGVRGGRTIIYRLDRLGIPLIEIATAPVIHSPKEAEKVALTIGRILKATGKVKRGIGTIRQDLNISIKDGALIEIKGVQELGLIAKVVENEVRRQVNLLKLKREMEARGLTSQTFENLEPADVSHVFRDTKSGIIRKALASGGVVLAVKLPGMKGLLKFELCPGLRFGGELADRAKFYGRVGGIFHTDELPAYGISAEEVEKVKEALNLGENDAAVLVADTRENAEDALKAVVERVKEALKGVPEETRAAMPDGITRYMRPRPGAARMYPETDIPSMAIPPEKLEALKRSLPPLPDQLIAQIMETYKVNRKLAEQLADSEYLPLFKQAVSLGVSPSFAATALTETMKNLERRKVPIERVEDSQLVEIFKLIGEGQLAKENFPILVEELARKGGTVQEAIERLGLRMLPPEEIEAVVERHLNQRLEEVKQMGGKAFGFLMKLAMSELRGKADPSTVSSIIRRKLQELGL